MSNIKFIKRKEWEEETQKVNNIKIDGGRTKVNRNSINIHPPQKKAQGTEKLVTFSLNKSKNKIVIYMKSTAIVSEDFIEGSTDNNTKFAARDPEQWVVELPSNGKEMKLKVGYDSFHRLRSSGFQSIDDVRISLSAVIEDIGGGNKTLATSKESESTGIFRLAQQTYDLLFFHITVKNNGGVYETNIKKNIDYKETYPVPFRWGFWFEWFDVDDYKNDNLRDFKVFTQYFESRGNITTKKKDYWDERIQPLLSNSGEEWVEFSAELEEISTDDWLKVTYGKDSANYLIIRLKFFDGKIESWEEHSVSLLASYTPLGETFRDELTDESTNNEWKMIVDKSTGGVGFADVVWKNVHQFFTDEISGYNSTDNMMITPDGSNQKVTWKTVEDILKNITGSATTTVLLQDSSGNVKWKEFMLTEIEYVTDVEVDGGGHVTNVVKSTDTFLIEAP